MVMKLDDLVNAMRYAFFRSGTLYVDISSEAYKFYVEISYFKDGMSNPHIERIVYLPDSPHLSVDSEWSNFPQNIKNRSIEWIAPSFYDSVVEAFLPKITNEFVKAKLESVPKFSDEFKRLFDIYVEDDYEYGEGKKFYEFKNEYWHETARKFCDEHGIEYEE